MYDDKIWVFDNIVDFKYQEQVANTLLANNFNWFFLNDITDNKGKAQIKIINDANKKEFSHFIL